MAADIVKIRGRLGAAIRFNYSAEEIAERRADLDCALIENFIERTLADEPPLTGPQLRRLKRVLESYGPRKPAAPASVTPDEDDRVAV